MPTKGKQQQKEQTEAAVGPPSKKVQMMPPASEMSGSKHMVAPYPLRADPAERAYAFFNGITHFAGLIADDLSKDIKGQANEICTKFDRLLSEINSDKTKITRADIFVSDKALIQDLNEAWEQWISEPQFAPACSMVVSELANDKALVQISIIAVTSAEYGEDPSVLAEESIEEEKKEE